jgi:hypothetical protein
MPRRRVDTPPRTGLMSALAAGPHTRRTACPGAVAQLVERLVRNEEVRGSTPLGSTRTQ